MTDQLNILIVDDEEGVLELLKDQVESIFSDTLVTTMNTARAALEKTTEIDFNIILTDISMPEMSGLEFLQALKEREVLAPVIVISGHGSKENITEALRSRAFDFIDKPFEFDDLKKILTKARAEDEKLRHERIVQQESLEFLKEIRQDFIVETSYMLDECEGAFLRLESSSRPQEDIDEIFRLAHSIKGSANAIGIKDLGLFAHEVENLLMTLRRAPRLIDSTLVSLLLNCNDAFKAKIQILKEDSKESWDVSELKSELKKADEVLKEKIENSDGVVESIALVENQEKKSTQDFIRVPKKRIDHVSDLVGELIVLKSQLMGHPHIAQSSDVRLNNIVRLLDSTLRELQDRSMELGLDNMKGLFLKIQRVARDTADKVKKPVNFKTLGEEVEIDRMIIESLHDPLLHIIRNSIDHGVESVEKRKAVGKPEQAQVSLTARQAFGKVIIEVKDDGGGINPEIIFKKALEKGLVQAADSEHLSKEQKIMLIFEAGFSTAESVTDLSGRGVGLDVVKTNIQKMKGKIEVDSELGSGSCFRLILPMSQAVTEGMIVRVDKKSIVVPLLSIKEVVCLNACTPYEVKKGFFAIDLRGESVPLYSLGRLLRKKGDAVDTSFESQGIVLETHRGLMVLSCHDVLEQSQLVVKGLGEFFDNSRGVAGGAILGDGSVALVVDIEGLLETIDHENLRLKEGQRRPLQGA